MEHSREGLHNKAVVNCSDYMYVIMPLLLQ